ncbi:MAG: cupin domain-containing protein [Devosia sp.]
MAQAHSPTFNEGKDIPWRDFGEGRRQQILAYRDDLMMVRFEFAAGAVGEPHRHPHSQCAYVEKGVFDMTIDGVTRRLGPGSAYVVDPDVLHGVVCIEAGSMIDCFTPHRADFIAAKP